MTGRRTALRETYEETGLVVLPEGIEVKSEDDLKNVWDDRWMEKELLPVVRLVTIQMPGRRYDCFFYVASHKCRLLNLRLFLKSKNTADLHNLN